MAYDLFPVPCLEAQLGIRYVSMDELLQQSDVISVHAPAADGQPIVRQETLAQMKDGVILINTSRGSNVDEDALLEALQTGKVWAAGLDVYREEPTPNHDLYTHPRASLHPISVLRR